MVLETVMSGEAKTLKRERVEAVEPERRNDEWSSHVQRMTVSGSDFEKLEKAFAKNVKPNAALRSAFLKHRR
jgi:hypothetical protein